MELPRAKWLKSYSWCIIVVSAIETVWVAPGTLFERVSFSAFSCITVVIGFVISFFIASSYIKWLKLTKTVIDRMHRQNIEDIAILLFYFGVIGSCITVLIYPIIEGQRNLFSFAPMGIGFMLGAKWISSKYNPRHKAKLNNVRYLDRQDISSQ